MPMKSGIVPLNGLSDAHLRKELIFRMMNIPVKNQIVDLQKQKKRNFTLSASLLGWQMLMEFDRPLQNCPCNCQK